MSLFFSIVTVSLDAGQDLFKTVASVGGQRFANFEHLIKDGGSTDGSLERVQRASQTRIISRQDTGIYNAMNQALTECMGKYVLFLNAGDVFFDDGVLEAVAQVCGAEHSPGLVYTDYATTFEHKRVKSPHQLRESFLFRTMLCHQACFVRKDYFELCGGFDTSLKVVADFDFLLRIVLRAHATTYHIPIVGVISKEGGYSSRPEIFKLALREVEMLRRRYFVKHKRLLYGACYALTIPRFRNAVVRNPSLAFLRSFYRRAVNAINSLVYGQAKNHR